VNALPPLNARPLDRDPTGSRSASWAELLPLVPAGLAPAGTSAALGSVRQRDSSAAGIAILPRGP